MVITRLTVPDKMITLSNIPNQGFLCIILQNNALIKIRNYSGLFTESIIIIEGLKNSIYEFVRPSITMKIFFYCSKINSISQAYYSYPAL